MPTATMPKRPVVDELAGVHHAKLIERQRQAEGHDEQPDDHAGTDLHDGTCPPFDWNGGQVSS